MNNRRGKTVSCERVKVVREHEMNASLLVVLASRSNSRAGRVHSHSTGRENFAEHKLLLPKVERELEMNASVRILARNSSVLASNATD